MSRTREEEALRGRGASWNPENRFPGGQRYVMEEASGGEDDDRPDPRTIFLDDTSKTILTENDSPDVGMGLNLNPYRGCEHGCIYCYARPTHEYFGLSAGLDFETKIFIKRDAPTLLRQALSKPRYRPQTVHISGITDCYQPGERIHKITRGCLEVLTEFRNPVGIITKNRLVTRDIDLLGALAAMNAAQVFVSVTSLEIETNRRLEPRSSSPAQRLDAIRQLSAAGIPTGVMVAPVVPGITDHELPKILEAARAAGASRAGYIVMRLPYAVAPLFEHWLDQHYPDRKDKVLNRIRDLRGGRLNDPRFGTRMSGEGPWAEQLRRMYQVAKKKCGYPESSPPLATEHFRRPAGTQLYLWSETQ